MKLLIVEDEVLLSKSPVKGACAVWATRWTVPLTAREAL